MCVSQLIQAGKEELNSLAQNMPHAWRYVKIPSCFLIQGAYRRVKRKRRDMDQACKPGSRYKLTDAKIRTNN